MIDNTSHKDYLKELRVYEGKQKRVGDVWKMQSKGLVHIIENCMLALRKDIFAYTPEGIKNVRGVTVKLPYADLFPTFQKYGVVLNQDCDNMGETLVHEALHIKYPDMSESAVDDMMKTYWNKYPTVRKAAQQRVVEKLGEYDDRAKP